MNRIILTTDLSPDSTRAFAPTVELAQKYGTGITLLTVVEDLEAIPHGAPLAPLQHDPELSERSAVAKARLAELSTQLGDLVDVETKVLTGAPIHTIICNYAAETCAPFLAMSTHGRTGFRHLVVGSVAEAIMRHATVPTLCVPQKTATEH